MRRRLGVGCGTALLVGVLLEGGQPVPERRPPVRPSVSPAAVTFNKHIAPLVFDNCVACHRPDGAGPFSLLTYEDVRSRAAQIVKVTSSRYMPPWLPEPGVGDFYGERRLSDAAIARIRQWVETGAAEGDPADLSPVPRFTDGWELGPPDLVLTPPAAYPLRADGPDVFRNLVFEAPVTTRHYVRAVEIRLNDRRIGHHANLLIDRTHASRRLDAQDAEVGFSGMEITTESEGFDPDSHFLFWKPGTTPYEEPAGMAWRLDRGDDLVLNMHLRPSGKPELVRPTIGLYFTDTKPTHHPMLMQLEHDGALDIPPGARGFAIADEYVLPEDVDVLAVYPHAHYLGKEVRGIATLPDGASTWLIHIKAWDVNQQGVFRFLKPVFLPQGTTITMQWTYDNSEDNVRNPHHPPQRVRAGNRAEDEMGHLWLQVLPRTGSAALGGNDPRIALQEALMRRRLVKYPADFTAHFNLGAALQAEGRLDEAMAELRKAVAIDPGHATAHNNLGAALHAQGHLDSAAAEYRRVLQLRPDDAGAHYNLGQTLRAQGQLDQAVTHYREALRLEPGDAQLHAQLGAALQQKGTVDEAIGQLRNALQIDPNHADARYNLGQALLGGGDWEAAAATFREALERNPADADAHDGLGLALLPLGRPDEAIGQFEEALRARPDDPVAHGALGEARFAGGKLDEAIGHFQEVLRTRPDDADVHNNLGSALAAQGRLVEATAHFERALRLDPAHAAARANLERARAALKKAEPD